MRRWVPVIVTVVAVLGTRYWIDSIGDRDRSVSLLVGLNLLNLLDAVLTVFLVSTGAVVEANPVIAFIGMPGKIVLVGVASYALHRLRPRVMPYLVGALALVVIYQLAGTIGTLLATA